MKLVKAFHAPEKVPPSRKSVSTVISQATKFLRVPTGRVPNPVYKMTPEYNEDMPTLEELQEWTVQRHVRALSYLKMPLVPEWMATDFDIRLARIFLDEITPEEVVKDHQYIQDIVMADNDDWQGVQEVSIALPCLKMPHHTVEITLTHSYQRQVKMNEKSGLEKLMAL